MILHPSSIMINHSEASIMVQQPSHVVNPCLRHDLLHDVGVAIHQTQAGFTWLLSYARGDHHHVRILADIVGVTCPRRLGRSLPSETAA